jgi:DNA-binding transcriptional LysR family regulator
MYHLYSENRGVQQNNPIDAMLADSRPRSPATVKTRSTRAADLLDAKARVDHEIDTALLAVEVEPPGIVEDGRYDREHAFEGLFDQIRGCRMRKREMDLSGLALPTNPISTASTFVTITLLMQDAGLVSVLPTDIANLCARHGMLRILPIELQSHSQSFGIVTRKGGALSPPAERFIETLMARVGGVEVA